eukprot:1159279-Pelagomonas_calceolata.AAC.19
MLHPFFAALRAPAGAHFNRDTLPGAAAQHAQPPAVTVTAVSGGGCGGGAAGPQPPLRRAVQLWGCEPCACTLRVFPFLSRCASAFCSGDVHAMHDGMVDGPLMWYCKSDV